MSGAVAQSGGFAARRPGGGLIAALMAVVLWEVVARLTVQSFFISAPSAILAHMADHAGLLWRAFTVTLWAAVRGFAWGNLAGVLMALLVVLVPRAERLVSTLALLVFCLPLVATGP